MKSDYPRIEIDDLAAVIRESIQKHKNALEPNTNADSPVQDRQGPLVPELKLQPDFEPRADDRYHINDLLRYHDRAFIHAAYQAILKRPPAEAEYLHDRKRLQEGRLNKIDLLAAISSSVEGKAKRVHLEGLTLPALIRRLGRLPLIGYPISLGVAFLRLPKQLRDQRQFAAYVAAQNQQLVDFVNAVSTRVTESRDEVFGIEEKLSKQLDLIERLSGEQQAIQRQEFEFEKANKARFKELDEQLVDLLVKRKQLENTVGVNKEILLGRIETEVGRRIEMRQLISEQITAVHSRLQAEIERLRLDVQRARSELTIRSSSISSIAASPRSVSASPETVWMQPHELDALYAALEDRFRGGREEIKKQFKLYLPYVSKTSLVIDLGCGRGEWLEILAEAGIKARGIDKNRIQVEQCRTRGLDAIEDDFLGHLRSLDDASVGAVTGFHIIEHLSIEPLVQLLNELMRVLHPGGVVIFETPNPDNVLVGGNFFYMDPTHHHPLPSQLMEFLLQNRGFHPTEVLNLHPWEEGRVEGAGELADRFNGYFYGPMDYAIVGWKVGS